MATSYDAISVFATRIYNVTPTTGEPARVRGTMASTTFFDVLGVSPVLGRGFVADDAEPGRSQSIVLSFGFWQRQFAGKPDVINQIVRLNGQPYTIVGVMPATLNFPDTSNFWVPATYDVPGCGGPPNADPRGQRGAHCLRGVARLKEGVSIQQANAEMRTISDQLGRQYPEESSNFMGLATSLQDRLVGSARTPLLQRTQEIGIRVALGATSREILGLVLFGSLKPVIGGLAIGVIAALGLTRLLSGLVYGVSTSDPVTFISLPAVLGIVAFLAGLFPALRATRVDPLEALRVD